MKRLTGLDASFLYMETPTSFMHVANLMILDPSTAPHGFDFDSFRALYEQRLDQAPPFRRRLVEVPFGLNHPIWIEDPDFDLDWHLRHIAVPRPGGMKELCELAGHLVAIPLDRSRPLWEAWLIDGLEGGHVAVAEQGAPRRHRRGLGRGAARRHPRPVTRDRAEAAAGRAVEARSRAERHRDDGVRAGVAGANTRAGGEDGSAHRRGRPAYTREQPQGTERQATPVTVQRTFDLVQRRARHLIAPSPPRRSPSPT